MPRHFLWITSFMFAACLSAVAGPAKDTAILSAQLKALRGKKWLTANEYADLQKQYLAWIDSRLRAGVTAKSMNRELKADGLFPRWPKPAEPDAVDEMFESHAGFLEPISEKYVRGAKDVLAIEAGIYKGSGCSLDVTTVLYQRQPFRRLGYLNADPSEPEYAFYLSGLDVSTGRSERIVATGWVASNCTSTWNGKRVRIDTLRGSSVEQILQRDLNAQDQDEGESVAARVEGKFVTFRYRGATGDGDLLSGPAIARYQIIDNHAILASPVALTRAGFIYEWLRMPEADAAHWSEPEAAAERVFAASSIEQHSFDWERVANCGGSPPIWEVGLRLGDSNTLLVFRISGARATELRMMAITASASRSCVPEDTSKGLTGIAAELPW